MFKREDYKQTRHDSVFTKWQVLIGSNDWEDFRKGKDGAARYRVQNLPCKSCPGLYELGIAIISHDQGRHVDSDDVLVAYLGQAESVRSRLQRYGRSGAHLRNVNLTCEADDSLDKKAVTAGLFEDTFLKGGSVVYRWAPMRSKRDAEVKEVLLLGTFDYAWNKGSNGERRHHDLLKKLGDHEFMSKRISCLPWMHLFPFTQKQVGVKIKGEKHTLVEERKLKSGDTDGEKSNLLSGIFKLSRSRPRLVSDRHETVGADSGSVCGVILKDGGSCTRSPVKGRRRCEEHKGQRIFRVSPGPSPEKQKTCEASRGKDHQESNITCGVILVDGETCRNIPVSGRKRCEEHKGMRINAFLFLLNGAEREKSVKDKKSEAGKGSDVDQESSSTSLFCEAMTKSGSTCTRSPLKGSRKCWQHKERTSNDDGPPGNIPPASVNQVACGVKLCDGSVCERSPVKGRKRCEQHKGMRITS